MYQTQMLEKPQKKLKPLTKQEQAAQKYPSYIPNWSGQFDRLNYGIDSPVQKHMDNHPPVIQMVRSKSQQKLAQYSRQKIDDFDSFRALLSQIISEHITSAECTCADVDPTLWDSIKKNFKSIQNLHTLISKTLSFNTTGVNNPENPHNEKSYYSVCVQKNNIRGQQQTTIKRSILHAFLSMEKPISETLNDIYYWMRAKNATSVSKIVLTDSDMHTRGVGVCIVHYQCDYFYFCFFPSHNTLVIKPEDKSFEKAVYGREESSLASVFNRNLSRGMLGSGLTDKRVGTLDIQTSTNNQYGSSMEYFPHQRYDSNTLTKDRIDIDSVKSMAAFSSILGLADLHVENAVYSKTRNPVIQLIDAEIGMKYLLSGTTNPLTAAVHKGEMHMRAMESISSISSAMADNINGSWHSIHSEQMRSFIDSVKTALTGRSARIVILPTPTLYEYRFYYLTEVFRPADKREFFSAFVHALNGYFNNAASITVTLTTDQKKFIRSAVIEFSHGRIPYFTLSFSDGVIRMGNSSGTKLAVFSGAGGRTFLETMIADRIAALLTPPQQPLPEQSD